MRVQADAVIRSNNQAAKRALEPGAGGADEAIDIARIRLSAGARTVAVLGELRAADRLLLSWVQQAGGDCKFDVEVTFLDGFVCYGCYEVQRCRRGRPSLGEFVRLALRVPAMQRAGGAADLSRYAFEAN